MTEPEEPSGATKALLTVAGIVLAPLLLFAITSAGGGPTLVVAGALVVGSIVLIARGGAGRGLGTGVLIGLALLLIGAGALFAICASQT